MKSNQNGSGYIVNLSLFQIILEETYLFNMCVERLKNMANLLCSILPDNGGELNSELGDASDGEEISDGEETDDRDDIIDADTSEYDSDDEPPGRMPAGWEGPNKNSSENNESGNNDKLGEGDHEALRKAGKWLDRMVKLVCGGSDINKAYPV